MIIYRTTNLVNGKQYIGKDKNNNTNYLGSGTELKLAIKEFGKYNFKKEIIECCNSMSHLIEREIYWLLYYDVENNPNFYNKTNKSFGNSGLSDLNKQNIKKGLKNRVWNPEWGKKSGQSRIGIKRDIKKGKEHKNTGKIRTDETKKNMSLARIGKKHDLNWNLNIKNNRNKCIEVNSFTEDSIIVENEDLLNKWNPILEEHINREVDSKIKKCFEESLMKCSNKSLHREYQMKKIL